MHGFESVVGPVKGVFDKETSLNKAREHSLLRSDRPAYVTILSLGNVALNLHSHFLKKKKKSHIGHIFYIVLSSKKIFSFQPFLGDSVCLLLYMIK